MSASSIPLHPEASADPTAATSQPVAIMRTSPEIPLEEPHSAVTPRSSVAVVEDPHEDKAQEGSGSQGNAYESRPGLAKPSVPSLALTDNAQVVPVVGDCPSSPVAATSAVHAADDVETPATNPILVNDASHESSAVVSDITSTPDLQYSLEEADEDENVMKIEQCCKEWRVGRVAPYWMIIDEPKFGRTQGCALRIHLSEHLSMVWSVDTTYDDPVQAKKACAEVAVAEGVLEFIKHGDGQVKPSPESDAPPIPAVSDVPIYSVQSFFESLPRPFPEPAEGKSAHDLNGSSWLNTMIQSTRGAKLVAKYIWTIDGKMNLHGCLLRLERPGQCVSYMVDPKFSKRAEAKAAVCLLAMSQGVGNIIRQITAEVDTRLPADTRRRANEFLPILQGEYQRLRPGATPTFEFTVDRDACGCSVTVELVPSPTPEQMRTYTVSTDYRSRNDAKAAVLYIAAQEGVMEFIRFRGTYPPSGYVPFDILAIHPGGQFSGGQYGGDMNNRKRKYDWDSNGGGNYKRFRPDGNIQGNFSGGQNGFNGSGYHKHSWNNGGPARGNRFQARSWSNPHVPGPSGVGNVANYATGQSQPGLGGIVSPAPAMRGYPQAPPISQGALGGGAATQSAPYMYTQGGFVNGGGGPAYYASPAPPFATPPSAPYPVPHSSSPPNPNVAYGPAAQSLNGTSYPPYYQNTGPYAAAPQYSQPVHTSTPVAPHVALGYPQGYQYPHPVPQTPAGHPPQSFTPTPYSAQPSATAHPPQPPGVTVAQPVAYTQYPQHAQIAAPPYPYNMQHQQQQAMHPAAGMHNGAAPTPQNTPATSWPPHSAPPPAARGGFGSRGRGGKAGGSKATAGPSKLTIAVESAPKSNVTALYDHCSTAGLSNPQFYNELVTEGQETKHKVWVIVGKQRLELPITFSSLSQGQERVAKKVLEQLRSQAGTSK
ncbi:hypothetical protein B0H21DRAFT_754394 [Amylocystis lapponica]|nr:hypothetical protein B0H21DRAFT_754394 [Amylocystis lapponica]